MPLDSTRSRFEFLLTIAVILIMSAADLHAQKEDRRISPVEPWSYALPSEIAIQSAAVIGGTGLVVWGTTALGADGVVAPVLRMQYWRGKIPIGVPTPVHSESGVPFGRVVVEPIGGKFLVMWNDRRSGGKEIYMRMVDTTGLWIGPEMQVAPGTITSVISYPALPGMRIITSDSAPPVAVHVHGAIDRRDLISGVLSTTHCVGDSGVVAVLHGDTVAFHGSVFDTVPFRTLHIPELQGSLRGGEGLFNKGGGEYELFFATHATLSQYPYAGRTRFFRMTISPHAAQSAPMMFAQKVQYMGDLHSHGEFSYAGYSVVQGCGGSFARVLKFSGFVASHGDWYYPSFESVYSVDSRGGADSGLSLLQHRCDSGVRPLVTRLKSDTISVVRVVAGGDTILVSVPTYPFRSTSSQIHPRIWSRGDSLWCHWYQVDSDRPFMIARLLPGQLSVDSLPWPTMGLSAPASLRANGLIRRFDTLIGFERGCGVDDRWEAQMFGSYAREYALHLVTRGGWRKVIGLHDYSTGRALLRYTPIVYAIDPDSSEIVAPLLITTYEGYRRIALYAVSDTGAVRWHVDSVRTDADYSSCVPIRSGEYLLANRAHADRFIGADRIGSFIFFDTMFAARYVRLQESFFLRYGFSDADDSTLKVELYTIDGALLRRQMIPCRGRVGDPVVVQRRSDGMIALLYVSNGLHCVLYDRLLQPIGSDTVISATTGTIRAPAAVFHRDTLVAIWQDYRNGDLPDIYGASLSIPLIPAVVESTESHADAPLMVERIAPNPSRGPLEIVLRAPSAQVEITIIDAMGRITRRDVVMGTGAPLYWSANIEGLASGHYLLRVQAMGMVDVRQFILLR